MVAFSRPRSPREYDPPLSLPAGLLSFSASHKPQGRDISSTKRRWTEHYPPMRVDSTVQTFLDNLQTWRNQRTSLDVTEKQTGTDELITAVLIDFSYQIVKPRTVVGLAIEFAEI